MFCNQRKISGCEKADFSSAEGEIENALSTIDADADVQIAFFGGSFTGIERADMIYLLETAKKFIDAGKVGSIRLSTRPDYIDEEILDILARYGVKTIELGIQSMSDEVLLKSGRGHNSAQTEKACALITSRGFELIGQMMTGLPGATEETELYTAKKICSMGACGARIYPTVVFRDTELCRMMERGDYSSPDMETVISEGAKVLAVFVNNGVNVIRIGLQSSELLTGGTETASPYHEATGELIWSRFYRNCADGILSKEDTKGKAATIYVGRGAVSKMIGQKRANEIYLKQKYSLCGFKVREMSDASPQIKIILEERKNGNAIEISRTAGF